jgi:hypothetical protein
MNFEIERALNRIEHHLGRIADALDADRPPPDYRYTLAAYPAFNWTDNIAASVVESDDNGATRVMWRRRIYTRRSNPRYGHGVWFSRGAGRDDDGNATYERLITFSTAAAVEPLPAAIAAGLTETAPVEPAHAEPATPTAEPPPPAEEPSELDRYFPEEGQDPAPTETDRKRFFRLLPLAIAAGLEPGDANSLTAIAKRTNYTEPLATLEQHIKRLEDAATA